MKAKLIVAPVIVVVLLAGGIWYLTRPQVESYGGVSAKSTAAAPTAAAATPATTAAVPTAALPTAAAPTAAAAQVNIGDIEPSHVGRRVAFEGTIVSECPRTGCSAVVEDSSGQIRIDCKPGGFTLPLGREGSKVRVTGTVVQKELGNLEIAAESAEL